MIAATRLPSRSRSNPRSRRVVAVAGITAAALLAAGIIGDRIARSRVEKRISERADCVLHAHHTSVDLRSFTAVPRLLTGDLGTVDVTAHHAQPAGTPVDIAATLDGVRTDGHVASSRETITASYTAVLAGQPSSPTGNASGHLKVDALDGDGQYLLVHATVAQLSVPIVIAASLTPSGRGITLTPVTVAVLGRTLPVTQLIPMLGHRSADATRQLGPRTIPLDELPTALHLDKVTPAPDGLMLTTSTGPIDPRGVSLGAACS